MFGTSRKKMVAGVAVAIALTAIMAACGGDDDSASGADATAPTTESTTMDSTASIADAPFGAACAQVPTTGEGSVTGMANDPVATAASNNPLLSTLVSAVTAANLGDTLNSADALTVFAPANSAFAAMDQSALQAAMADPTGALTKVLTYHVLEGRIAPDELAGTHRTLEGQDLTVSGSGETFAVNGSAKVVCGNVQTANATVYVIDGVLSPPAS
jgi:uncharacterized surface protein with fasciclin (FAS1) repeats